MPIELISDTRLTRRDKLDKDLFECPDQIIVERQTWSKSFKVVASLFEIVKTNTLLIIMKRYQKQTYSRRYQGCDDI